MTALFSLDRLAIHHIDKGLDDPEYATSEEDLEKLHADIIKFFADMSAEVWNAQNTGATRSAQYASPKYPSVKPTIAKELIEQIIINKQDKFFANSKELAKLLHEKTPGQASSGLLAVLRLLTEEEEEVKEEVKEGEKEEEKKKAHVVILKIYHDNENFVRVRDKDLTQLEIDTVKNMLIKGIQKGACIPHPHRDDYDLKIIDRQQSYDPARYFARDFLGCAAKMSDQFQIKNLIPTLSQYAQDKKLPLEKEKLPGVIDALQKQPTKITTKSLCKIVRDEKIFGKKKIKIKDFTDYIDKESSLGKIDIPVQAFAKKSVKARKNRRVRYKFRDPTLEGITLEGPPDKLKAITSVNGPVVTITLTTTTNGYTVHYD